MMGVVVSTLVVGLAVIVVGVVAEMVVLCRM